MRKFLFITPDNYIANTIAVSGDSTDAENIRDNLVIDEDGDILLGNRYIERVLVLDTNTDRYTEYTVTPHIVREIRISV